MELIRTPFEYFNLVSGGIRFSTLTECWGGNQSGKSTFCYQTAGYFMKDYPNSIVLVVDTESSFDYLRCKHVFGWDLSTEDGFDPKNIDKEKWPDADSEIYKTWPFKRIKILPAAHLEQGFFQITQAIKECTQKTFVFWDTPAAAPTKASFDNTFDAKDHNDLSMWAGGRTDRPRVIKHYLMTLMGMMGDKPIVVFLPNQVFTQMNKYGGGGEAAGGGNALKHDLHYSFHFKLQHKSIVQDEIGLVDHIITNVELTKSKFCPRFSEHPLYIDVAKGGLIDKEASFFLTCSTLELIKKIKKSGQFYTIAHPEFEWKDEKEYDNTGKIRYKWNDLWNNRAKFMSQISKVILSSILKKHFLIRMMYVEEFGKEDLVNEVMGIKPEVEEIVSPSDEKKEEKTDGSEQVTSSDNPSGQPSSGSIDEGSKEEVGNQG